MSVYKRKPSCFTAAYAAAVCLLLCVCTCTAIVFAAASRPVFSRAADGLCSVEYRETFAEADLRWLQKGSQGGSIKPIDDSLNMTGVGVGSTAMLVSKNFFGIEHDNGETAVVFDVSFEVSSDFTEGAAVRYGFVFGLPDTQSAVGDEGVNFLTIENECIFLDTQGWITGFPTQGKFVDSDWNAIEFVKDKTQCGGADWSNNLASDEAIPYGIRVIGESDGTVKILRRVKLNGDGLDVPWMRVDAIQTQGHIGFVLESADAQNVSVVFASADDTPGLLIKGNTIALTPPTPTVESVSIKESVKDALAKADEYLHGVALLADVSATPESAETTAVNFSIVQGGDIVYIENGKLYAVGVGDVTIKAASVIDESKFDTYTFVMRPAELNFDFTDSLGEVTKEWSSSLSVGVNIEKERGATLGKDAFYCSQFSFADNRQASDQNSHLVFDIEFSYARVDGGVYFSGMYGLAFGSRDRTQKLNCLDLSGENPIYYKDGVAVPSQKSLAPEKKLRNPVGQTQQTFRVKAVGYSDGTLLVYQQARLKISDEKIAWNLDNLCGIYSDGAFGGGISLFNDALDGCTLRIFGFSARGIIEDKVYGIDSEQIRNRYNVNGGEYDLNVSVDCYPDTDENTKINWTISEENGAVSNAAMISEDGKRLVPLRAGFVILRAVSAVDTSISAEKRIALYQIRSVKIQEALFQNLKKGCADLPLSDAIVVDALPTDDALICGVAWAVVSGPAAVTSDGLLHISGGGTVVLKAVAIWDSAVMQSVTFDVVDVSSVRIVEFDADSAIVGGRAALQAFVDTCPDVEKYRAVTWVVTDGEQNISLEQNGEARFLKAGWVTLRAVSVVDNTFFAEYRFEVKESKIAKPTDSGGCGALIFGSGGDNFPIAKTTALIVSSVFICFIILILRNPASKKTKNIIK